MKNTLLKDTLRSISANRLRFISIIIIVALGISFFIGIKSSSPAMGYSANEYFRINNLLDVRVTSRVAFSEEDISKIENIEKVDYVVRSKFVDAAVSVGGETLVDNNGMEFSCRVISFDTHKAKAFTESGEEDDSYVNRLVLKDGRYPENPGECVIDATASKTFKGLEIGSVIRLNGDNATITDSLRSEELTIVGTVDSPMFISSGRGSTQISSGELSCFAYVSDEEFSTAEINELFVKIKYDDIYDKFSDEYKTIVRNVASQIKEMSTGIIDSKLSDLKVEYNAKIDQKKLEINAYNTSSAQQIADKKKEITDFKAYVDSEDEILADRKAKNEAEKKRLRTELDSLNTRFNTLNATYETNLKLYESQGSEIQGYTELKKLYDELNSKHKADKINLDALEENMKSAKTAMDKLQQEVTSAYNKKENLLSNKPKVEAKIKEIDEEIRLLEAQKDDPDANLIVIQLKIGNLRDEKSSYQDVLSETDEAVKLWEQLKDQLPSAQSEYSSAKASYDTAKVAYDADSQTLGKYTDSMQQLTAGQNKLTELAETVEKQSAELEDLKKSVTQAQIRYTLSVRNSGIDIQKAQYDLDNAKTRYYTIDNELTALEEEVSKKKANLSGDLKTLENTLNNLDNITWQTTAQCDLVGHSAFEKSMSNILSVSDIFPVIFLVTAMIACFVIMMKNVEEERGAIGLFKACGYSNMSITVKYLSYAVFAWLGGAFVGGIIGTVLLPTAVYSIYDIIYTVPNVGAVFNFRYIFLGLLISFITTMIATFFALSREMRMYPAALMRPRMIGYNRRSVLEKMPEFWGRLPYGIVLLIRTVIRSRKRVAVGCIAIACCTALILSAFGLLNSANAVVASQYGSEDSIFKYDVQFVLTAPQNPSESTVLDKIRQDKLVTSAMLISNNSMSVSPDTDKTVTDNVHLVVPHETDNIGEYINLEIIEGTANLHENGVVLSQKLAKDMDAHPGDTLYFTDADDVVHPLNVIGVVKNYIEHYAYMSADTYERNFISEPEYRYLVCVLKGYAESQDISNFASSYIGTEDISGVATAQTMSRTADAAVTQVLVLVLLFVASACLLAMIVMYTTSNVNISERTHEIANIKVIGFSNSEVLLYVTRENIISTVIGTVIGIVGGVVLHKVLVNLISVDTVMYGDSISWWSFLVTVLIIWAVAALASLPILFKINKVNMAETLKSIE